MFVLQIKLSIMFGVLTQSSASQGLHSNQEPQTALATSRFLCTCFTVDYFLTNVTIAQESYIATDKEADERSCMNLVGERLKEKGVRLSSSQIKEYCMACNCMHSTRNLLLMKVVAYGIAISLFWLAGLLIILKIISISSPCRRPNVRQFTMMKYLINLKIYGLFGEDEEKNMDNEYEEL